MLSVANDLIYQGWIGLWKEVRNCITGRNWELDVKNRHYSHTLSKGGRFRLLATLFPLRRHRDHSGPILVDQSDWDSNGQSQPNSQPVFLWCCETGQPDLSANKIELWGQNYFYCQRCKLQGRRKFVEFIHSYCTKRGFWDAVVSVGEENRRRYLFQATGAKWVKLGNFTDCLLKCRKEFRQKRP